MIPFTRNIYYGWWIVAAAILCQFLSVSAGQVVVGIFMQPVITELGWPVWRYTLGPALALGIGSLSGPFVGPLVDRQGPRRLIVVGALVCALAFYLLSRQSTFWIYLTLHIVAGVIGWNLFGPLVVNATLVKWFVRRRGWALAIGSVGVSLAGMITPLVVTGIVDGRGWRAGYVALALAMAALLPVALLMRRAPEDHGLAPDGDGLLGSTVAPASAIEATSQPAGTTFSSARSLTRDEAVRTPSFWLLVFGFGCNLAALNAVLVHAIPFVAAAGFARSTAALALTVNGFGNLLSKAVWGYSLQRIAARRLALTAFSCAALGVSMMMVAAFTGNRTLLFLGFFAYGFGFGGTIPLSEYLWAEYFGRVHIGAIRGFSQPITVLGPVLGPILVGLWYDATQSYQPAFGAIIGVYLTAILLIGLSRKPAIR